MGSNFSNAIKYDPSLFVAYYNRASVNYFLKKYDFALADIQNAMSLKPENAMCYFYEGVILGKKGDYNGGISSLEAALHLVPDLSFAYEEVANLHKAQENYDQALATYDKAIQLNKKKSFQGLMHYYKAVIYALQEDEKNMYASLKKAHSKKVFRDKKVYLAFGNEKAFKSYRLKPTFKKIAKKARKEKKENKFEASELSWFRLEH